MSKGRDSVYNVSTDIRLEDYTGHTSAGGTKRSSGVMKTIIFLAIVSGLFYAIYRLFAFIGAPDYKLAIANQYIDDANIIALSAVTEASISASDPVYIRFQWPSGELSTDYLQIKIYKVDTNGRRREEANIGRRKPTTANYVYFMGPLEVGKYALEVMDREGDVLKHKVFMVH